MVLQANPTKIPVFLEKEAHAEDRVSAKPALRWPRLAATLHWNVPQRRKDHVRPAWFRFAHRADMTRIP